MTTTDPDLVLIAELCETIERTPPAIEARKLLVHHYLAVGWQEAATDSIRELKRLSPHDEEVKAWYTAFAEPQRQKPNAQPQPSRSQCPPGPPTKPAVPPADLPRDDTERAAVKVDFLNSLRKFRIRAGVLLKDARILSNLQPHTKQQLQSLEQIDELQALAEGRITSVLGHRLDQPSRDGSTIQPQSVRAVARDMIAKGNDEEALRLVVTDFSNIVGWKRSKDTTTPNEDAIRDTLVRRVRALEAALPEDSELRRFPAIALMHMDHEYLKRKYINTETMLGDTIEEIAQESFFASEDGYAWDMDELAQAITSNSGIMRNPLSRQMFSRADIHFIINHPKGKSLAAMQVEQSKLKQGIRPQTVEEMQKLAKVLLEDQSADQIPTRHAVDHFFAYVATLPKPEQKAIDQLRVPAKDSHTGQAFDGSIGDSLRDAQANRTCFHKTGDFIQQAANHLRH